MKTILNVKTMNLRKEIFCPECESTSFVKINLRKVLKKSNFILQLLYLFSQKLSLSLVVKSNTVAYDQYYRC